MFHFKSALIGIAATLSAAAANAGELKVISAGAVRTVIGGMIDDYTRKTGHQFAFVTGPTGMLRGIIAMGADVDLIIASGPLMAELEATGKITPGSRVDLGRIGLGVVIRNGAAVPTISTPEDFKQLLIKAESIAYTDPTRGGTSYLHLMKVAEQFGIADVVTKKGVHATGGDDAVDKVAQGKAEIAVVLISEIHGTGAKLAAPLPDALQLWTVYSAAIPASSTDVAGARALVAALTGPAMRERWTAAGWQPVAK